EPQSDLRGADVAEEDKVETFAERSEGVGARTALQAVDAGKDECLIGHFAPRCTQRVARQVGYGDAEDGDPYPLVSRLVGAAERIGHRECGLGLEEQLREVVRRMSLSAAVERVVENRRHEGPRRSGTAEDDDSLLRAVGDLGQGRTNRSCTRDAVVGGVSG